MSYSLRLFWSPSGPRAAAPSHTPAQRSPAGRLARLARLAGCLVVVAGSMAGMAGMASMAQAQDHSFLAAANGNFGTVLFCEPTRMCTSDGSCEGPPCLPINDGLSVCAPESDALGFETFCCDTVADCPTRATSTASACAHLAGDVSICLYRDVPFAELNFCALGNERPTLEQVLACFARTDSGPDFFEGDCDDDGIKNAIDPEVCVPQVTIIPIDDGGVILPPEDPGTSVLDLGNVDTGDTTTSTPSFQGGGGCSVASPMPSDSHDGNDGDVDQVGSGRSAFTGMPALLLLVGLFVGFRRRDRV